MRRQWDGLTALMRAADNGHVDCVRLLIEAGAEKDAKDSYVCVLSLHLVRALFCPRTRIFLSSICADCTYVVSVRITFIRGHNRTDARH